MSVAAVGIAGTAEAAVHGQSVQAVGRLALKEIEERWKTKRRMLRHPR